MTNRRRWVGIALAILGSLTALLLSARPDAHASDALLRIPAPAGTVWHVTAGYNTASHVGDDPYALDLVRDDAETAGTPVLAPLDGTVDWRSDSCLSIADGRGSAVLLCHFFPRPEIERGMVVAHGEALGVVAPAGMAENNGLPHIHLAVHTTLGAGQIQQTLPFSGAYALDGHELPATVDSNAYAGEQMVSTNVPADPVGEADSGPAASPTAALPASPEVEPLDLLPGWNLVGWTAITPIADAIAPFVGQIDAVYAFDAATQTFQLYMPGGPTMLNSLTALATGTGLMIHVTAIPAVPWAPPPLVAPVPLALSVGFNLVTWTGPRQAVADATQGLADALVGVFAFDAVGQRYQSFRPDVPPVQNDLTELLPGQAVWVEVRLAATWTVSAPAPSPAEADPQSAWVLGPGCLNLRPEPSTVGTMPSVCLAEGTPLSLTGDTAHDASGALWYAVSAEGQTGWVYAAFLSTGPDPWTPDGVDGQATFYDSSFTGQPLACGGVYDPSDATIAAATSWPCGTRLRVSRGSRFVDVVVCDTGLLPSFHVDLSAAAFQKIGDLPEGNLSVHITVLGPP